MKKIIVALVGKAGAGKDTLLNRICQDSPNYHKIISCTTRPMRKGEIDGEDYYFISHEAFAQKILNEDMLEATEFNDWFYGTMKSSLIENGINIGIFNPEGYNYLTSALDDDIYVIGFYVRCDDKVRLMRQLNREENPDVDEIIRRYTTDKQDFVEFDRGKVHHVITLENSRPEQLDNCRFVIQCLVSEKMRTQHLDKIN